MFKVHATKMIWANADRESLFDQIYRDIELPFPPYIGLVVTDEAWISGMIKRVSWGIGIQTFHVEVQDATPCEGNLHDLTAEWLRDSEIKDGWFSYKAEA